MYEVNHIEHGITHPYQKASYVHITTKNKRRYQPFYKWPTIFDDGYTNTPFEGTICRVMFKQANNGGGFPS